MNQVQIARRAAHGARQTLDAHAGTEPKPPSLPHSKGQLRRRERERAAQLEQDKASQLAADRTLIAKLRQRLIDLRVSMAHARHIDDLKDELDDILYVLKETTQ